MGKRDARKQATFAKLAPPRLHGAVARQRLFDQLDENRKSPVIWVSGPPGAGKTTLIASYVKNRSLPCFWFQFDAGDRDPATFFHYLGLLFPNVGDRQAQALPQFSPAYLPDLPGFTRRFFRAVFASLPPRAILVFDDCQEAMCESVETILREGLAEVPEGVTVIALSRGEAPTSLARMRVAGHLFSIGGDELRLTLSESTLLAHQVGLQAEQELSALHARVDGWAAGMVICLAAFGASGTRNPMLISKSKIHIFEFFAGEIFDRAPAGEQEALMRSALFPQFTAAMVITLSEYPAAGALLDRMYRDHYFIDRREDVEPLYRYHDLFREFLLAKFESTRGRGEAGVIGRHAAKILERNDNREAAIELLLRFGETNDARRLLRHCAQLLIEQGRHQRLASWLSELPREVLDRDSWLAYWLGETQLPQDGPSAERIFLRCYEAFAEKHDDIGAILAAQGIVHAITAQVVHFRRLDRWIAVLAEKLPVLSPKLKPTIRLRAWCAFLYATHLQRPNHSLVPIGVDIVQSLLFRETLTDNQKLEAGTALIIHAWPVADAQLGHQVEQAVAPVGRREDTAPLSRLLWLLDYGAYKYLRGDWRAAIEIYQGGVSDADRIGIPGLRYWIRVLRAYCYLSIGDTASAASDVSELTAIGSAAAIVPTVYENRVKALLASQLGRFDEAKSYALRAVACTDQDGPEYMRPAARADVASVLVAAGALELAENVLAEGEELEANTGATVNRAEFAAARAYLSLRKGERTEMLRHLSTALSLARNPGLLGKLSFCRPGLPGLLSEALRHGIEPDLATRIINEWAVPPPSRSQQAWPWRLKMFALGRFEIYIDDEPIAVRGRVQYKVLELARLLIALGPGAVANHQAIDALWPDSEGDTAAINLKSTVHRLRALLGGAESLRVSDGKLNLNTAICWVDSWAFEEMSETVAGKKDSLFENPEQLEEALALYRGCLFPQEQESYLQRARQRLRSRFLNAVQELGRHFQTTGNLPKAATLYRKALEADPYADVLYRELMICLQEQGRINEAANVFLDCQANLASNNGKLSAETLKVFELMREN